MNEPSDMDRIESILQDQERSIRSLDETFQKLLPVLARANESSGRTNQNRATITQTDRTPMWICVVIVVALVTMLLTKESNKGAAMAAVQAELTRAQAERMEVRAEIRELRATDNAVRAYINTGILKPKNEAAKTGKGN